MLFCRRLVAAPLLLASACGPSVVAVANGTDGGSTSGGATGEAEETTANASTTTSAPGTGSVPPGTTTSLGGDSSETTGAPLDIVELRIEPAYAILDSAVGGQQREFTAIAITDDGDEVDVTAAAQWSLDGVGSLDAGVLTTPRSTSPVFERAELIASLGGEEAITVQGRA